MLFLLLIDVDGILKFMSRKKPNALMSWAGKNLYSWSQPSGCDDYSEVIATYSLQKMYRRDIWI